MGKSIYFIDCTNVCKGTSMNILCFYALLHVIFKINLYVHAHFSKRSSQIHGDLQ